MLDRDPNATFIELEELDDFVRYNDSILSVTTSQYEESFRSIMSLEVENFLNTKRYFRIAPGIYSGFGNINISKTNITIIISLFCYCSPIGYFRKQCFLGSVWS